MVDRKCRIWQMRGQIGPDSRVRVPPIFPPDLQDAGLAQQTPGARSGWAGLPIRVSPSPGGIDPGARLSMRALRISLPCQHDRDANATMRGLVLRAISPARCRSLALLFAAADCCQCALNHVTGLRVVTCMDPRLDLAAVPGSAAGNVATASRHCCRRHSWHQQDVERRGSHHP